MSLDKVKSDQIRIEEMIVSSLDSQEVKKEPILTAEGKPLDASASMDAYMTAFSAHLEAMLESPTTATFAAEESVKSSSEEETIILVPEEEEVTGPFSVHKGGSAAISLDAYIKAMNAQLESINLRRQRASMMIDQEYKMTKYAANNVMEMGKKEKAAHWATGFAHIAGAAVQGVGLVAAWRNSSSTEAQYRDLEIERSNADNMVKGIDEYSAFRKLPDTYPGIDNLNGRFQPTGGAGAGNLNAGVQQPQKVDLNGLPQNQREMFESFDGLDASKQQEIITAGGDRLSNLRNNYKGQLEAAEMGLTRISNNRNAFMTSMNMWTGMGNAVANGIGSIVHGHFLEARAIEEAQKMQNELAARYASQDVSLNNETASARESDLNNSIRLLREITGADVRA